MPFGVAAVAGATVAVVAARRSVTALGWCVLAASWAAIGGAVVLRWTTLVAPAVAGAASLLVAVGVVAVSAGVALRVEPSLVKCERGEVAEGLLVPVGRPAGVSHVRLPIASDEIDDLEIAIVRSSRSGTPFAVPTQRRISVQLGPPTVRTTDLFGLTRRDRTSGDPASLVVRPRARMLDRSPTRASTVFDGPIINPRVGGAEVFHALREYQEGDDLRLVHWRSSMKVGQLMVREYIEMTQPVTAVVVDQSSGGYASLDQFDQACDIAASVMLSCAARQVPVVFASADVAAQLMSGPDALAGADGALDLIAGLERRQQQLPLAELLPPSMGAGIVFLVSGEGTNADVDVATLMARGCRVVQVRVQADPAVPARTGVGVMKVGTLEQFLTAWTAVS